jgi:hypothetical protein
MLNTDLWGWGPEGHQVIAKVAEDHLLQTTKVMIQSLIGNNHLYSIASWADTERTHRRDTGPWHYVDIPLNRTYEESRDCGLPQLCVVAKINGFARILTDKHASREVRAEALKFIVHLVGDIHQPMHAALEARGANEVPIQFFGSDHCGSRYTCNLHALWDSGMIQHTGLTRDEYAIHEERLINNLNLDRRPTGNPEQWANESRKLATAAWVPDDAEVGESYYEKEISVVDLQMASAGLRLANLLNTTIGKMSPREFSDNADGVVGYDQRATAVQNQALRVPRNNTRVWLNKRSSVYHCPSSRWYGRTKGGEYLPELEALQKGFHAAAGRMCGQGQ